MNGRNIWLTVLLSVATALNAAAAAKAPTDEVMELLREYDASTYAFKAEYGAGIESMTLGFDDAGEPVIGVAVRETKTYKKVTTIAAVIPAGDGYKIVHAGSPNLEKIPGLARKQTSDALRDINGRALAEEADARKLVDAVTGATKYYQAIYLSYGVMSSRVIRELKAGPDWPRHTVPPAATTR